MAKNYPKLMKDIKPQSQEPSWNPNRQNSSKIMPKQIMVKLVETKEKQKISEEKTHHPRWNNNRFVSCFQHKR
jgi:hypothetical protein